ncbi:transportin-PC [Infundibulicybe gibba]|nr:transportin-PC [Infundibulicybe gibba]
MAPWTPQPSGLQEILQTIHESTDMNTQVQRNITQKLNQFTRAPEYIAYLAYILSSMPQEEDRIRTIAGYLLKNNSRLILGSPAEVAEYVKTAVLQAFTDTSIMIRNAASQDIVAFLGVLEPKNWPECLQHLVNALDSTDIDRQEAAFNALEKACEDYPRKMDFELNGTRPLDFMIPKFLMLSEHPSAKMRSHASLLVHIDTFIACLFKRASDDDPSVRRHVCQALVLLLAARPEKLMPEMANVAEDKNENVALEACEFWLTFAEDADLAMYLHPLLEKVAPVLLDYAAIPDKETDIKPRHYGGKSHGLERDANGAPTGGESSETPKPRIGAYGQETIDSDGEDDYDLDDDDFDDEMSTEWNLRKCAAAALDVLAVRFSGDLLNVLLGPLKEKLWSPDWLQRESGILALGAMAEGEPPISPYHAWTTQPISEDHKNQYFIPTMEGLLRMVLDNNKRVQEAGCKYAHLYDAVGTLADAVGRALQNPTYVEILMPPLTNRWSKLKDDDDDLIPLLECLASVTIAMGPSFLPYAGPVFERCTHIIHSSLLRYQAFQQNPDTDEPDKSFLVVALDLLSGLTQGLGMGLEPLITQSNPNLLNLLTTVGVYALVGDMAMGCFVLLRPHMPGIMAELILQLDPEPKVEFISASNNAAWSVGEVALRYGRDDLEFQQWVNPLISRLIPILLHPKAPPVSIGRIGYMHPVLVAPHLPEFAQAWCQALYEIRDNEEKDSAFRGLCTLVRTNPAGIAKSLLWFCNSIVRWTQPSPELNEMFQQLLQEFKQHDGPGWAAQVASFPPVIQERLATRYGV